MIREIVEQGSIEKGNPITTKKTVLCETKNRKVDLAHMTLENNMMVDYSKKYQGKSSAEGCNMHIVGWKVYTIDGIFAGLLDEDKVAMWYVNEKSCVEYTEAVVQYDNWYVGNIYNPRNKTKTGREIVKGFMVEDTGATEFVHIMTPDGEIKKVYNPLAFAAENFNTVCDLIDDTSLYISTDNIETRNEISQPAIGIKVKGRRSGEFKGIITLEGRFIGIDESKIKPFKGPFSLAKIYK